VILRKKDERGGRLNKTFLKSIAKHMTVFAGVLFILWLLLFLSALIPNDAIRGNMEKSAFYYKERDAFEITGDSLNSTSDNYADSIWLNVSWNMGRENALKGSIQTEYYDGEELGENAGLYYTVFESTPPNMDYTRYWHGTAMFIRLFHLFTDVSGVKIIVFLAFLIFALISAVILCSRKHWDIAVMLALSLVCVQAWNIRLSMEYQPAFVVAFAIIPLYLILERKNDGWLTVLSVISGTLVAFFDFLTTETVTILLPLALVVVIRAKEGRLGNLKETLLLLIKCGVCWICAYGGAFVVKWVLASLVSGGGVFETALSSVAERMGTSVGDYVDEPNSIFSSVASNFSMLFGGKMRVMAGRTAIGVLLSVLIMFSFWYIFRSEEKKQMASLMLIGIGLIVVLRYFVLNNHSYIHCFFTFRALVSLIFALLSAMWINLKMPQKKRGRK